MALSKPTVFLALLLLSTAGPAAGASVMRVKSGGEVEMMQTESVSDLANMFSDDPEEKAVTSKLLSLAEGEPSQDLLPFVQKLKEQIQPWHDNAEKTIQAAIAEIESCTGSMENGMLGAKPQKDSCSAKGTEHMTSRKDESAKLTTKEDWKAQEVEKKEIMTTECTVFEKVEEEAKKATASYSGGDEEAYLESVSATFCDNLLPRYEEAKQKCTSAKAEHVEVAETYETKKTAWTVQKTASDKIQTEMDETCCEYAIATKDVCTLHDTCYEDKVEAYKAQKAIIEAEEKVKKVEWRVYSRIECFLPVLGTDKADAIEECRKKTHDASHLDIDYGKIPAKATCEVDEDFPGTDAYKNAHPLPDNAKGKAVAVCTGMSVSKVSKVAAAKVTLGRFDIPVSFSGTASATDWTKINAKDSVGFAFENYPGATEFRACIAFTGSGKTDGQMKVRLRKKNGAEWFQDSWGNTWSSSGLIHNKCGPWRKISSITCGFSWTNTCQLEMLHTQGVNVEIYSYDFELRGEAQSQAYDGRFDIPVSFSGTASATSWTRVNAKDSVGFSFSDYPGATEFRACIAFTGSGKTDGDMKVRLRKRNGAEWFQDSWGNTWSSSGLVQNKCGEWRKISSVHCGFSWTNTCQLEMLQTQNANVEIYSYDFELRGPPSTKVYDGRFDISASYSGTASSSSWTKIDAKTAVGFRFSDYPSATEFRPCVAFTGSGSKDGEMKIRLRKKDGDEFFQDSFGNTWSGSGLIHNKCGQWRKISSVNCGFSWTNTCELEMLHTQGVNVVIDSYDFELRH